MRCQQVERKELVVQQGAPGTAEAQRLEHGGYILHLEQKKSIGKGKGRRRNCKGYLFQFGEGFSCQTKGSVFSKKSHVCYLLVKWSFKKNKFQVEQKQRR